MPTKKQIAANQTNCAKSSGPVTESGKKVSSLNSLKWGVFSEQTVLPDEDKKLFDRYRNQLLSDLNPVGLLEISMADKIVASLWRWRRLYGIEAGLFTIYRVYEGKDRGLATAFAHDGSQMDSLGRLTRYETALERRFLRLLHELQRLQAARAGVDVPPPAVVDVDVQGEQQVSGG